MVLVFHVLFFQIDWVDGQVVMQRWEPGPPWWPATWVGMLLPLFFVAGGYGHAASLVRADARRDSVAWFLVNNGRRLLGPLLLFTGVVALVATVTAWLPGVPPETPFPGFDPRGWPEFAVDLSRQYCAFLWFIPVYLFVTAMAPAAVRLHDRFGLWVPTLMALAAGGVDAWSLVTGNVSLRYLNWLLVWPLCHQLGIGYHRGWLRRGPLWVPLAGVVVAPAVIGILIAGAGYPGSAIVSYYPPTVTVSLLAVAQVSALGLLERAGLLCDPAPWLSLQLGRLNAVLVTVYLWLNTAIVLAVACLLVGCTVLPGAAPIMVGPVVITVASLLVLWVIVPPLARLGRRLEPPLGERQRLAPAIAGYLLLTAGMLAAVTAGMVVHPQVPSAAASVLLVWGGAGLIVVAAGRQPVHTP